VDDKAEVVDDEDEAEVEVDDDDDEAELDGVAEVPVLVEDVLVGEAGADESMQMRCRIKVLVCGGIS